MFDENTIWYFITKDTSNITCDACPVGSIKLLQPIKSSSSTYEHSSLVNTIPSLEFDIYFYYDLARLVIYSFQELIDESKWPMQLTYPKCGEKISGGQLNERSSLMLFEEISIAGFIGRFGKFSAEIFHSNKYISFQEANLKMTSVKFESNQPPKYNLIGEWIADPFSSRFVNHSALQNFVAPNHYRIATVIVSSRYFESNSY